MAQITENHSQKVNSGKTAILQFLPSGGTLWGKS